MYSLSLLGNVGLTAPGGSVPRFARQHRQLALLAVLSAADGGTSREKLQSLLWAERTQDSARHSLSDAIYRLRKALGPDCILAEGETVRLNPLIVCSDLAALEAALRKGELMRAVSLYRGPFMDGFHLDGSRAFEDWRDLQARRVAQRVDGALEVLAEKSRSESDPRAAADFWARLAEHDPLNTRYTMGWMRALVELGDVGNAIKLGEDHGRLLREELQAEPPPELQELLGVLRATGGAMPDRSAPSADRIRRGTLPFQPPAGPMRAGHALPFVGRESELSTLDELLSRALEGEGCVAFITGEAGVGKTALASAFGRRAEGAHSRLVVVSGQGNAHTGPGDPYLLFRETLALLTGDVEDPCVGGSLSADRARRLWALLPASVAALLDSGPDLIDTLLTRSRLRGRLSAFTDGDGTPVEELMARLDATRPDPGVPMQQALCFQLVRVLRAISRENPVLLIVDDLQWADPGSLNLLSHLGRHLEGSRILILGLYRPSEVAAGRAGQRHPLEPVVNELKARFGDVELPLDEAGDRDFLESLLESEPTALRGSFRDTLFRLTRGHALFTVELIRAMKDQGVLVRNEEGVWVESGETGWDLLPARIEAVIAERVGRVGRNLRRVLAVAATEGERFSLEAVARVLDAEGSGLPPDAVQELEQIHHLICPVDIRRSDDRTRTTYRFRHILFQRYVYNRLTQADRIRTHALLGQALEALHEADRAVMSFTLARHFQKGDLPEKAWRYWKLAGERARNLGAFPESVGHLEAALDALLLLPPGPDRDRSELELQLDLAWCRTQGALAGQEEACLRASELADHVGSEEQLFGAKAQQYWTFAHYAGEHRKGRELADQALSLARQMEDAGLLAHGLEVAGCCAHMIGDYPTALLRYQEMADICAPGAPGNARYSSIQDPGLSARVNIGYTLWFLGFPDRALALCRKTVAGAKELRNPSTLLMAQMFLGFVLTWRRDCRAARQEFSELGERVVELGVEGYYEPFIQTFAGWCMAHEGHPEAGVRSIAEGLRGHRDIGWSTWSAYRTGLLADALRVAGRPEEGLALWEDAHDGVEEREELAHEPELQRIKGRLLLALQKPDPDGAEAAFRHGIAVARRQESRSYELRATIDLATLLEEQNRGQEAKPMLGAIHDWFTEGHDTPDLKDAALLLSRLADSRGS